MTIILALLLTEATPERNVLNVWILFFYTNADNKSTLTNVWKKERRTSLVPAEPCTSIVEIHDFPVSIQ